jgi:hypothetical protein
MQDGRCAHPLNIGAASMTTILAITCWIMTSAVCTPFIGRFLYTMNPDRAQKAPEIQAHAARVPRSFPRETSRRRASTHSWPRKVYWQPNGM